MCQSRLQSSECDHQRNLSRVIFLSLARSVQRRSGGYAMSLQLNVFYGKAVRCIMFAVILTDFVSSSLAQTTGNFPPSFAPWNIESGAQPLVVEFSIKKAGVYEFWIIFGPAEASRSIDAKAFLGDGSYEFVLTDTPGAKRLISDVDGSLNDLHQRASRGEIVRRLAHPGTIIQVETQIERLGVGFFAPTQRTSATRGVQGYRAEGVYREIFAERFEPGNYRIHATMLIAPPIPVGLQTSLAIVQERRY